MNRPELGEKLTISGYTVKRRNRINYQDTKVTWIPVDREPRQAMYIGYRRVSSGVTTVTDTESYHTPEKYHEVWLFVLNERTNPIHVLPGQVVKEDSDDS